jgi:hypothetical protein
MCTQLQLELARWQARVKNRPWARQQAGNSLLRCETFSLRRAI